MCYYSQNFPEETVIESIGASIDATLVSAMDNEAKLVLLQKIEMPVSVPRVHLHGYKMFVCWGQGNFGPGGIYPAWTTASQKKRSNIVSGKI